MDPLSVTAGIIAVLQLTTTLTKYITDAHAATKEQALVAIEASNLYGLLTSLRLRVAVERHDDPWLGQVKTLAAENGTSRSVQEHVTKGGGPLPSSRRRDRIRSALTWTFTKTEVDQLLGQIERMKTLINCALTKDLL